MAACRVAGEGKTFHARAARLDKCLLAPLGSREVNVRIPIELLGLVGAAALTVASVLFLFLVVQCLLILTTIWAWLVECRRQLVEFSRYTWRLLYHRVQSHVLVAVLFVPCFFWGLARYAVEGVFDGVRNALAGRRRPQ